jgi:catechol 2,3-dioxygenase-like lactoylglutathione lyase family enzyme
MGDFPGENKMINGAHVLLYSQDAAADRRFFCDVLDLRAVDVGEGWLIFSLPPAELGVHPSEGGLEHRHADHDLVTAVLYLMCDDVRSEIKSLQAKGVSCSEPTDEGWGITTTIRLPSGGRLGLYEPRHATALDLD